MNWFKSLSVEVRVGVLVVIAVAFLVCCGSVLWVQSVQVSGVRHEQALTYQYSDNQNEVSAYISGFYEQAGVLEVESEVVNQLLVDAVKGRYDDGGFSMGSPFFAAIAEAYPEASVAQLMENYGVLQDYISAGREAYKAKQSKLLDMLRAYDTWRLEGLVRPTLVRMLGFPSQELRARVGDMVYTGTSAENKMWQIVLTGDALKAYETGTMDPLKIPRPGE